MNREDVTDETIARIVNILVMPKEEVLNYLNSTDDDWDVDDWRKYHDVWGLVYLDI